MIAITMINRFSGFFLVASLFLLTASCVDLDYDAPGPNGLDPNIPTNASIADIKALHQPGQYVEIADDFVFDALVVSNDESGNIFKQLVLNDETGGIEMRIDIADLHNIYPEGRKVYVKAKGLWISDYEGLIQLGAGQGVDDDGDPELIRIPESIASNFIIPATYGNPVVPKVVTLDQLTFDDVSTLIQLDGMQFINADAGIPYADSAQNTNREIEDCAHRRMIMRNSGYSNFWKELTPTGNGTVVGILGYFRGDYQFTIRDQSDVMMTGDRCGGGGGTITVAQLREAFAAGTTAAPNGTLRGVVISDYTSESVVGLNLYVQDATGGIVLRFTDDHFFDLGDEITVGLAGGVLGEFNALLQVSGLDPANASVAGHPGDVTPRIATVAEILANAQAWESTLVKINNATLSGNTVFNGNVIVTDATGSISMFTRSASTFANTALPTGEVSVTAIVSDFNAPQLLIRNASDVSGGGTGGGDVDEDFEGLTDNVDISLPGWSNIPVQGSRRWRSQVDGGNTYAQATAFNDGAANMESWLITPAIVLDVPKKMTFESAYAFWTHQGLTVWISTNFNGTNVAGATWTQLSPVIAQQSDAEFEFIPSGVIDLSAYTGTVHIGFKYVGSGPNSLTTSARIDNVKVENL